MKIIIHPIVLWAEQIASLHTPGILRPPIFPATQAGWLWDALPENLQNAVWDRVAVIRISQYRKLNAPPQCTERQRIIRDLPCGENI
jgi:hypothetical protein